MSGGVLIVAEARRGELREVSLELVSAAREVAGGAGGRVVVAVIDHDPQRFALSGDLDTLDGIDESVEQFRLAALPQVEKTLLEQAQERTIAKEKKTDPLA